MSDRALCLSQNLVEGLASVPTLYPSLGWLVPEASRLLMEEIERAIREDEQGRVYAPDQYTVSLFPRDLEQLATHSSQVQLDIARGLRRALRECGLRVIRDPHVTLASDPTLTARTLRVIAWHSRDPLKFSKTMPVARDSGPERPPPGAFLIVEGRRHFPIVAEKVTIGRRLENDLILDDPHVSRQHAEIQLDGNRFWLIDMRSTVGTLVNGRPVQRHSLTPGDVITIAGVQLIYGEDAGGTGGEAPPYAPPLPPSQQEEITPLNLRLTSPYRKRGPR